MDAPQQSYRCGAFSFRMTLTSQFENQRFIALETYRKNGTPVITPLGFVQDGATLYVRTTADSGKVKRIRNNSRVRVVPGTAYGAAADR